MIAPTRPGYSPASERKVDSRPGSPVPRTARRWPARTMSSAVIQARRSMPFCQVSRLTSTRSGEPSACEAEARLDGGAVGGAAVELLRREGRGEERVGLGVPDLGVDAVDDAVEHALAGGDQAFEAHAEGGGGDLLGVGRADGGDGAGAGDAGLQEADAAVVLDAVEAEGVVGQLERREDRRRRSGPGRRCCGWSGPRAAARRSSAGRPARGRPASRGRGRGRGGSRARGPWPTSAAARPRAPKRRQLSGWSAPEGSP